MPSADQSKRELSSMNFTGPCFNGELFGYIGETCTTSVNLNGILTTTNGGKQLRSYDPRNQIVFLFGKALLGKRRYLDPISV